MFEDMPKEEREAAIKLLTGLTAEEERQVMLASVEMDLIHCEPGKERDIHEAFLKSLEKVNGFKGHNTGFFMLIWMGADEKGNVQGLYETGGNAPTLMLCAGSMATVIGENLKEAGQCLCPGCLLAAKIRAASHMERSMNKQGVGRKPDA